MDELKKKLNEDSSDEGRGGGKKKGPLETGVGQSILFFIISFILSFSLFLSVLSFHFVSLFSLLSSLSRYPGPPEGSALERHENQSLPPSRPPLFHLVVTCFFRLCASVCDVICVCVLGGDSLNLPLLCSALFFLGGSIPSTLKTNHLVFA